MDVAIGGALMGKSISVIKALLKEMASNNYYCSSERASPWRGSGKYNSMHDRALYAWPAMLFFKSLVLLHGYAHSRSCRTFRPCFLIAWLPANPSSLLFFLNSSLEPCFG